MDYYKEHNMANIPIFALMGDTTEKTVERCKKEGFIECIGKPFTKEKLINMLITYSVKVKI